MLPFGLSYLIDFLRGSQAKTIRDEQESFENIKIRPTALKIGAKHRKIKR